MDDMDLTTQTARITALWMVQGNSLAKLLRRHGRGDHADNLDAALSQVAEILSSEIGRDTLTQAMIWASEQVWSQDEYSTAGMSCN